MAFVIIVPIELVPAGNAAFNDTEPIKLVPAGNAFSTATATCVPFNVKGIG